MLGSARRGGGKQLAPQPGLADLHDYFDPWGSTPQDEFYLDLVLRSPAVLDVGCGTGKIQRVAREGDVLPKLRRAAK
ncbi:hypothetical protein [Nocardiopsis tropica]|uniref:hypothetical protein n=1 Tax=Nocardiopsis tropica TaxID=109330 RepID=UPI0031E335B5